MTILSARYSNADQTAILATTVESGSILNHAVAGKGCQMGGLAGLGGSRRGHKPISSESGG